MGGGVSYLKRRRIDRVWTRIGWGICNVGETHRSSGVDRVVQDLGRIGMICRVGDGKRCRHWIGGGGAIVSLVGKGKGLGMWWYGWVGRLSAA